jgi:hypothetical protein
MNRVNFGSITIYSPPKFARVKNVPEDSPFIVKIPLLMA